MGAAHAGADARRRAVPQSALHAAAIAAVVGARLALRRGTKLVVAAGLVSLSAGLAWTASATASTSYLVIVGQMILLGAGIGLTSAPATESIIGAVPKAKAGVGSAINDATRILGGTLGVAVIGSIYASLYGTRLSAEIGACVPESIAHEAHSSVGSALGAAGHLRAAGHDQLAEVLSDAASAAFFRGFSVACVLAAGVSAAGACLALFLLPARPPEAGLAAALHPIRQ